MNTELNITQSLADQIEKEWQSPPSVFQYDDYRLYLQDYYRFRKSQDARFSFRFFSARVGYRSPSVLQMVIKSKRNLSDESIARFSKALGLSADETVYFRNLVFFNQSAKPEDRQRYAQEIVRSKGFKKWRPLDQMKFEYWSKWFYVAIYELVSLEGFHEDSAWIAQTLNPPITKVEAREALDRLLALGLIARNSAGKLEKTAREITTGDQVLTNAVTQFHRDMIARAQESIDRFRRDVRQVSSLTLSLSPEGEKRLRHMVDTFRKEVLAFAEHDSHCKRVVQLNFQIFPLSNEVTK